MRWWLGLFVRSISFLILSILVSYATFICSLSSFRRLLEIGLFLSCIFLRLINSFCLLLKKALKVVLRNIIIKFNNIYLHNLNHIKCSQKIKGNIKHFDDKSHCKNRIATSLSQFTSEERIIKSIEFDFLTLLTALCKSKL